MSSYVVIQFLPILAKREWNLWKKWAAYWWVGLPGSVLPAKPLCSHRRPRRRPAKLGDDPRCDQSLMHFDQQAVRSEVRIVEHSSWRNLRWVMTHCVSLIAGQALLMDLELPRLEESCAWYGWWTSDAGLSQVAGHVPLAKRAEMRAAKLRRFLSRSWQSWPKSSPPIGESIHSIYTYIHIITHMYRWTILNTWYHLQLRQLPKDEIGRICLKRLLKASDLKVL